jgi:sigma54-dependent transcription regulator
MHERVYEELVAALAERAPAVRLHPQVWEHDDPTDHAAIYEYLRTLLPRLRRQFPDRELVVHLSPGTAAMHTVWALMAATGFIEPPFTAVQSFRAEERRGRPAVVPLSLGIDTFFRRWQETRPASTGEGERAIWDPRQFRSARLRALYDEARRVARLKVPVLLLGERGTGKTTLASWIRLRSPFRQERLDRAWPAVPCGQYTSETMRAELFEPLLAEWAPKSDPGGQGRLAGAAFAQEQHRHLQPGHTPRLVVEGTEPSRAELPGIPDSPLPLPGRSRAGLLPAAEEGVDAERQRHDRRAASSLLGSK